MAQLSRALFTSMKVHWATPENVYNELDREFGFTLDPCPLDDTPTAGLALFGKDGLHKSWSGHRVFCNPPYSRSEMGRWLAKAREADVAVYLVPSRTCTAWWHDYAMGADEIRFIRGRLRFGGAGFNAPFPSAVLIFRGLADRGTDHAS